MPSKKETTRRAIGVMLRGIFSSSRNVSNTTHEDLDQEVKVDNEDQATPSSQVILEDTNIVEEVVLFGIEETATLSHFARPKPPRQRRPPGRFRGSAPSLILAENNEHVSEDDRFSVLEAQDVHLLPHETAKQAASADMSKSVPNLSESGMLQAEREIVDKYTVEQEPHDDKRPFFSFWNLFHKKHSVELNTGSEEVKKRLKSLNILLGRRIHRSESFKPQKMHLNGSSCCNSYQELIRATN